MVGGVGITLIFCWCLACFVCFRRGQRSNFNEENVNGNNNKHVPSSSRVVCVSLIAFWELLASGTSSLLMSQSIFRPYIRGLTIVSLAGSTITVRIIQIIYYKCKLSNIASKKQMIVENERLLSAGSAKKEKNIFNMNSPQGEIDNQLEMAIMQSLQIDDGNNNNDENNNIGRIDDIPDELKDEKDQFKERAKQNMKVKEEKASELMNYNFALYFISFSTFTDASFDIIQGIILLFGFSTTTQPLAVLGSLIGFSTEIMDFFEGIINICNV